MKFSLLERKISKLNVGNNDSFGKGLAIVTTAESLVEAKKLVELRQKFNLKNDHFKFIVCTEKPIVIEDKNSLLFSASAIKGNGDFSNKELKLVFQQKFEIVIGFSQKPTKLFQFVFKLVQAPLKTSNHKISTANLIINADEVKSFENELLNYYKTIKQIR
ncbi:DUF6913 domain-containing protein [Zunongwangia sp.]|uniref:DUF6913 domain-containing protein n=1 Tax=Zunongwangia sp. TaxID=1965325 RepID=UPI003AA96798